MTGGQSLPRWCILSALGQEVPIALLGSGGKSTPLECRGNTVTREMKEINTRADDISNSFLLKITTNNCRVYCRLKSTC